VRNVEFYIDDVLVGTDGNFPFEARFVSPVRTPTKSSFTLKARATDTGGNFTWTPTVTVALVPDATAPRIKRVFPGPADVVADVPEVGIFFNEPMDTAFFNLTTLRMTYAGPDYLIGTTDDAPVPYTVVYRADLNAASLKFAQSLTPGFYRLLIEGVKDLAVNLAAPLTNTFWALPDGPEGDPDKDDLINSDEILNRTNPLLADTDGDGWLDGLEVADRRDPLDPASGLRFTYVASPAAGVYLPAADEILDMSKAMVVARPDVGVNLLLPDENLAVVAKITVAQPAVGINLLSPDEDLAVLPKITVAQPQVGVNLLSPDEDLATLPKMTVAQPLVEILFPTVDDTIPAGTLRVASPPVSVQFTQPLQQAFRPLSKDKSPNL